MQLVHVIAPSIDAVAAHRRRGHWQWRVRAGTVYAVCAPRHPAARGLIAADPALHVLPAASNPSPSPAALAAALAAQGATATDTARTLITKLHAAGVTIFDPDL